ncbi:S-layer homology domain-containing protein [Tumebacillus algifaecis]|nr:S-layer homology domain-containing protein [Tumebacillus algifaecis]
MKPKKLSALLAALLVTAPVMPLATTESAFAATKLTAPTDVLLQPDRTVTWKTVANASGYSVKVYEAVTDKLIGERNVYNGTAKYALNDLLMQNGTYYARVTALGNSFTYTNSAESARSNTLTVSIKMTLPAPAQPTLTSEGLVTWPTGTNNGYLLSVYHAPSNTLVGSRLLNKDSTSADISPLIPALGNYYVKLLAKGDAATMEDSAESNASNAVELKPALRLTAPTTLALTEKRIATWNGVEGNNGYRISVYSAGINAIVGFLQAPKDSTQVDVSSLIRSTGNYYIRIQTLGANNSSSEDSASSASIQYFIEDNLYVVPQDKLTATTVTTDYAVHTDLQVERDTVLAELVADKSFTSMLVPVKVDSSDLSVQVQGQLALQLLSNSSSAKLRIHTSIGELTLPVQEIADMAHARSLNLADYTVQVDLKQTAAARPSEYETIPLQLSLSLVDKNKQAVSIVDSKSYLTLTIPVPGAKSSDLKTLSGVRLTDTFEPVPTLFRQNADGNISASFRYRGTATFAVKKKQIGFPDVLSGHYAKESIESLAAKSVIQGFEDNTFRPQATVTRAQFAAMLVKALGIKEDTSAVSAFTDVTTDKWYSSVVNTAYQAQLLSGRGGGIFAPEDLITAQEMATMVTTALRYAEFTKTLSSEQQTEHLMQLPNSDGLFAYALAPIALCIEENILTGPTFNTFNATKPADRAMAADMLYRMLKTVKFIN